jgi:catechol 2,3-dioxygenase-like lactoylglutathione lyase family enzyme
MAVTRIARISLTTADPERLEAFYRQAFGFERIGTDRYQGAGFAQLMGLDGVEAEAIVLGLGRQTLELVAFSPAGRPYPPDGASNDPFFQHLAIVVSDMRAAYAKLRDCRGWKPITRPEPQRLPPSSGGVTAFKFRDPEGHPLELLAFPPGSEPPVWRERRDGLCLGIDHSAIAVTETARSIAFYENLLGFCVTNRSLNHGEEQQKLDDIPTPIVEVTGLAPGPAEPPHLELLCYRTPKPHRSPETMQSGNDIAATRLVLEIDDLPGVIQTLSRAEVPFISSGTATLPGGRSAALIRDPDRHALLLLQRQVRRVGFTKRSALEAATRRHPQ